MKGEGKGFLKNFQPNSCWRATPKINYHSAVMCVSILSLMGQYAKEELHLVFPPMIWAKSCVQSPINITQDERNFDFSFLVFGEVFDFDCACTCYGCKGNRKSSKEITFSVQTFVKRERLRPAFLPREGGSRDAGGALRPWEHLRGRPTCEWQRKIDNVDPCYVFPSVDVIWLHSWQEKLAYLEVTHEINIWV